MKNKIIQKNSNNKVTENFFKIWITKEIIHKAYFANYYISFLDNEGKFDTNKYNTILNSIYDLISNNDATSIRPNNSYLLNNTIIRKIILGFGDTYTSPSIFSEEILTYIEGGTIKMDFDYELSFKEIQIVKRGLHSSLKLLYTNGIYSLEISETIDEIIKKTTKVLQNKKD